MKFVLVECVQIFPEMNEVTLQKIPIRRLLKTVSVITPAKEIQTHQRSNGQISQKGAATGLKGNISVWCSVMHFHSVKIIVFISSAELPAFLYPEAFQ